MRRIPGNIHRKVARAPQSGRQANRGGKRKRKRNTVRVSPRLPYHPGFLKENEEEMVLGDFSTFFTDLPPIHGGSISFENGY